MVDIQDEYDEEILEETSTVNELQERGQEEALRWRQVVMEMEQRNKLAEEKKPPAPKFKGRLAPHPDIMEKIRMVSYPTSKYHTRYKF